MSNRFSWGNLPLLPRLFLLLVIIGLVFLAIDLMVNPSSRVGPFGFGIPAPMQTAVLAPDTLSIEYPGSWVVLRTPYGDHGDAETIAVINVLGRSLPSVNIARRPFTNVNLSDVADWGTTRAGSGHPYESISLGPFVSKQLSGLVRQYRISLETVPGTAHVHCEDLYFLHGTSAYDLSFCSDEADWSDVSGTFYQMMLSVKLLE